MINATYLALFLFLIFQLELYAPGSILIADAIVTE
jgi:hypothetical protein